MQRIALAATACLALGLASVSGSDANDIGHADVSRLRQHVEYLAHDARTGRGPGTPGLDAAAEYIAARFEAAGLEPGGDDATWYQSFEGTVGVELGADNLLQIAARTCALDEDWRPYAFSSNAHHADVPLVFAGYGIAADEYDWNDYAEVDVEGTIVVVLATEPGQGDSTSVFEGTSLTGHSNLYSKAIYARERGALGMLVVVGPETEAEDRLARLRQHGDKPAGILCAQILRDELEAALPGLDIRALQNEIETHKAPRSRTLDARLTFGVQLRHQRLPMRNVVGMVQGRDPHRAIVIGAHYDHLGFGGSGSLTPDVHEPHNGADDNASGTAALLELARLWGEAPTPPPHTLVFAAFAGEEIGLQGSEHYVEHAAFPVRFTSAMLNMDMVGRLRDDQLSVLGAASAQEWETLLEAANDVEPRFELRASGDGYGPSDQMAFYKRDVAVLHFFTGAHDDYHKPSDDAEHINYAGLARVTDFVQRVTQATMEQELTFVDKSTPASNTGVGGFRATLGTIPDYSQPEDMVGVLLADVRDAGPAAQAGLRGGDLIVRIDDMDIQNIYDYMHVLNTRRPGERIRIVVERDDERLTLDAVLGEPKSR